MGDGERRGPRTFDPVVMGQWETQAWASYYRREWLPCARSLLGMVAEGFGMRRSRTLRGAWHVLRANQLWAPVPDNDPDGARDQMRRFYALVVADGGLQLDPARAAELEVRWWALHRRRQRESAVGKDELVAALTELYSYVYDVAPQRVARAAQWRVAAMDHSDAWVAAGCDPAHPLLAAERRALVASYAALRAAVERRH